ncbi:ABC transporter permease [Flocculibacter collagenilyticus]|uniref:ABC transporter permease n=1 Tax=Flocculibacter collagenilyticus TaxID=2744479 RepID=UPI0018F42E00|nr:FtsX-like permease family protein [Flocculibacter collagenilyticus]
MLVFKLALKSLLNRRYTVLLTMLSIAISVTLLLSVERIRTQTKANFANTVSGTDMIVGARTGEIQLLLSSIFHIGNATNNVSWQTYQRIANQPNVKWSIPLSLGDSHKGYRVVGTTNAFFQHYQFGNKQALILAEGHSFSRSFDVVLGAAVAATLNYKMGDQLVMAHGTGNTSFAMHNHAPFTVTGILQATGTPVDRAIYVSLAGIEAMHSTGHAKEASDHKHEHKDEDEHEHEHEHEHEKPTQLLQNQPPQQITAFLLGLKSRIMTLMAQRQINQFKAEPLLAIMPNLTLHQLWEMMDLVEQALLIISACVLVSALIGMLTTLLTSLNERRREMAILRSVGARPHHIIILMISEAFLITLFGCLLGIALLYVSMIALQPIAASTLGVYLELSFISRLEWQLLSVILGASVIIGAIPAFKAYRMSLSDGMNVKV